MSETNVCASVCSPVGCAFARTYSVVSVSGRSSEHAERHVYLTYGAARAAFLDAVLRAAPASGVHLSLNVAEHHAGYLQRIVRVGCYSWPVGHDRASALTPPALLVAALAGGRTIYDAEELAELLAGAFASIAPAHPGGKGVRLANPV